MTRLWRRAAVFFLAIVILSGGLAVSAASPAQAAQEVILYGDDAYPPYSYLEEGIPSGVYVQILRAAFDRLPEYSLTIRMLPWRRSLKMLEQGEAVGLFPPYRRPEERPYIGAYSVPMATESLVVYCAADVARAVSGKTFPADYAGLTFGNNAGFRVGGPAFEAMQQAGMLTVNESAGTALNLKMLLAGRVQCYINDRLAIRVTLNRLGSDGDGVMETAVIREEPAYIGWSKPALETVDWLPELTRRLDAVLEAMQVDGSIDRIIGSYGG
ncbi:substrate-binding periplasmic protein [Novispirillum itersonii]|uniref:Polar amino acid transport system substrate-binding protein n=1 Tax=Novispirillum itersonii TaxID=189 RepID=A0A7W9ZGC3_NOVIT|nr:transporter substrate-binding domain-containing protein [Novispirillum itersonii]MBB6211001.1 polar amino acid transport system substrate-binding protein [Novispirillum itersonii]